VDALRHAVALVALVGSPAALSAWFWIHPFAGFWRRAGARWAYAAMALHAVAVGAALFAARDALLAPRLPAPGWLVAPAAAPGRCRSRRCSGRPRTTDAAGAARW